MSDKSESIKCEGGVFQHMKVNPLEKFNYTTAKDLILNNPGLRGACTTQGMINLNKDMSNICDNNQCSFCNTVRTVKSKS